MKQILSVRAITEIAIFAALGFVLDLLQGFITGGLFPNGGSIGIAMVPIFIMCYRRGFICGLVTGLILGLTQMIGGVYAISDAWYKVFAQVALDYWLAYPLCAFAGLFMALYKKNNKVNWIIIGCIVGGFAKYLCHFLSGVIFWPSDAWNVGSSFLYSVLYNGAYMIPSIILCIIIMVIIGYKYSKFFIIDENN